MLFDVGQATLRMAAIKVGGTARTNIRRAGNFRENEMQPGILVVPIVVLMLLVAGCGNSPDQQAKKGAATNRYDAGKQMERTAKEPGHAVTKGGQWIAHPIPKVEAAEAGAAGDAAKSSVAAVEPVDFRQLRVLLPERIGALTLTSTVADRDGGPSIVASHAEGRYQGDDGSLVLTITDPGTLSSFAATAPIWMNMEFDRETDNGYEKTGNANGRRFHELYDDGSKSGEYTVIVGNRFVVEIHGDGLDMPTTRQAIDQIDLARLDAMKDVGVRK